MIRALCRAAGVCLVGVALAAAATAAPPRNDYLLVLGLRAGPYRFAETLLDGKPYAYPAAVTAFGEPTRLRTEYWDERHVANVGTVGYCHATWASAGITVTFLSFSGTWPPQEDERPPKIKPCGAAELATADFAWLRLFGRPWHNRTGIRVGEPLTRPRRARVQVPWNRWGGYAYDLERDDITLWVELDGRGRVRSIDALRSGLL